MSEPDERRPQKKETNQVTVNLGGFAVGIVLVVCLIWSIFNNQMDFAYITTFLLFTLAIFNHGLNLIYN